MSDVSPAPVVTESAPTSTAEIASQVIDSFEGGDAAQDDGIDRLHVFETNSVRKVIDEAPEGATTDAPKGDNPPAEGLQSPEAAKPTPVADLSPAAKFLQQQGHQFKKSDGRDTWLPIKTVEKMLDRYAGEQLGSFRSTHQSLEQERNELRGHFDEMRAAMTADPKAFIETLATVDQRYAAFLQQQAAQAQGQQPQGSDDPEPQPDYDLGNGQFTYSLDGLKKREDWLRRQLEKVVDEKMRPLTEREKRIEAAERETKQREQLQSVMQEAQSWPDFGQLPADGSLTEFQSAVLEKLRADSDTARKAGGRPRMTLREAYLEVRSERLSTDHTKVREQVMRDLQQQKGPALSRQATDAPRQPGPTSTADIAARTLARLERWA